MTHSLDASTPEKMILLLCLTSLLHPPPTSADKSAMKHTSEYRLIKDLFRNYDTTVRPRYNSSESVEVSIRFSLQQIYDLDEKRQVLTISGWLTAEWFDDFLTWNPDKYGGLQSVVITPKKMWIPKLAIGNSADRMFHPWRHFFITVWFDGKCRWQPGGNFAFTCALDMNYYPFDEQQCTMEIETWFYTADKVNITTSLDRFGLETYIAHGEWAVMWTNVTRLDVIYKYYKTEAFPEVYFTIQLRRKYTFYFMYILLPCMMLSFVLLMIFLLPAESGEKVSLGVSILVSFSVFLIIVAEQVPDTSDAVPVIAIYLMYFMMATALSVITSTMILRLHYRGLDKEPARWVRVLIFDLMAPLLCLRSVSSWAKKHRSPQMQPTVSNGLQCNLENEGSRSNGLHYNVRSVTFDNTSHGNASHGNNIEMTTLKRTASEPRSRSLQDRPNRRLLENTRVKNYNSFKKTEPPQTPKPPPLDNHRREWQKVAEVLDRFFFWIFLIFILIPLVSLVGFVRVFSGNF